MSSADAVEPSADAAGRRAGAAEPQAGAEDPQAGAEDPQAGAEDPQAGAEDPQAGAEDPQAGAEDPQAGAAEPRAGAAEPVPALATHQLTAGYGDIPVVRGVDLTVREGQLVAVVGPNGAGKSTLLKAILGLARVMGGRVLADGHDITGRSLDQLVRLGIGYVPQVDDVFDPLKVSENLNMGGYLLGKADRIARMEEVLAIFPALRSRLNRYVGTMSGGERKMTAIARALMLSPRVLVLDEPTAGLSAVLTESVLADQVRALADRGHAVLLVEQKAQAALRLAHTASVLVRGQVVMSAPAAEVLASREMAEVFLGGRGRRHK